MTYALLGTSFRLRYQAEVVASRASKLLSAFPLAHRAVRGRHSFALVSGGGDNGDLHRLLQDCRTLAVAPTWAPLVGSLLTEMNGQAIAGFDHFAVHAGVVRGRRGAIAFPAPSGAGKSTLTAACVTAGFAYVSDEALCVSYETGSVIPYPKPLALSQWSREALGIEGGDVDDELMVAPGEFGTVVGDEELHLSDVVLLNRRPGPPVLDEVPRWESMAALLRMSFNHYKHPEEAVRLAAALANGSRAWRLGYDHPRPGADLLAQRLG